MNASTLERAVLEDSPYLTSEAERVLNRLAHVCFLSETETTYVIIRASTPPPQVHQPDLTISSIGGQLAQGYDVFESTPSSF